MYTIFFKILKKFFNAHERTREMALKNLYLRGFAGKVKNNSRNREGGVLSDGAAADGLNAGIFHFHCKADGSKSAGKFWRQIGRKKRRMASAPTEVAG